MASYLFDKLNYSGFKNIPGAVYTRSGVQYQQNQAGLLVPFDEDVPPISAGVGVDVWEARTNVLTYSQDFTQAAWGKQGSAAVLGGQFTAPDSTLTGSTVAAGATSNSGIRQNITATTQRYSKTLYVGAGTSNRVLLGIYDVTGGVFVPVTARIVSGPGTLSGTTLIWLQGLSATALTRVEIVSNAALTGSHHVYIYPDSDNSGGSQTVGNTIRLWGTQLEAGAFASPYIPTTSAAATRGAPSMYINAPGLLVPPFAVVAWFKTANAVAASEYRRVFSINDGTTANLCDVFLNSSQVVRTYVQNSGTGQAEFGSRSFSPGALVKVAARFKTDSIGISVNGLAVESDNSATLAAQYSRIQFGDILEPDLPNRKLNGTIQRFQIINRDISDTELVNLTV